MRGLAQTRWFVVCLLMGVCLPSCNRNYGVEPGDAVGVYLTWDDDPTTTMTINWVDLLDDSGHVLFYRAKDGKQWTRATGESHAVADSVMRAHHVKLEGLKPDTDYVFVISETLPEKPDKPANPISGLATALGQKSDRSKNLMRFRTMPAELEGAIQFVTGGDMMRNREMVDQMNKVAAKRNPRFALLGGDLAYSNNRSVMRWVDWIQSWNLNVVDSEKRLVPMVVVIGNHEVRGGYRRTPERADFFYELFVLPNDDRSNFVLDFGDYLSIIGLDSMHTQMPEDQAAWLDEVLAARKDQKYLFAVYHFPAYGTAKAPGGELPTDNAIAESIREHWVPLFEKYGVTAVFENDHHSYKRTHRLRNHERDDENGILYLGDGAWGVGTRSVRKFDDIWYIAEAASVNHLWNVKLEEKKVTFEAYDDRGRKFDTYDTELLRTVPEP